MKVRFLLITVLLMLIISGCGKGDETETPQITAYTDTTPTGRYAEYSRLPVAASEPDPDGVSFKAIALAADGAYVMVQFTAPMSQSQEWFQGFIYIVDETTKLVYKDVPVMPIVGPLIGRPSQEGQTGYMMLMNHYGGIKIGSKVTVVAGKYKREHIEVRELDSSAVPK